MCEYRNVERSLPLHTFPQGSSLFFSSFGSFHQCLITVNMSTCFNPANAVYGMTAVAWYAVFHSLLQSLPLPPPPTLSLSFAADYFLSFRNNMSQSLHAESLFDLFVCEFVTIISSFFSCSPSFWILLYAMLLTDLLSIHASSSLEGSRGYGKTSLNTHADTITGA